MPMMRERFVESVRAIAFGRYFSAFAASIILARVLSDTAALGVKALLTADCDTPASFATSIDVVN